MKNIYKNIFLVALSINLLSSCSNETNITEEKDINLSRPNSSIVVNEVQIGNQVWMTKNLNVSKYRNGDPIPEVTNATEWANLTTGAYCNYANQTSNGVIYGKLYNGFAVNDPRGLAPEGWHIASTNEWTILINYLGGEMLAGGKMKEIGTEHWWSPNTGATNSSGFNALPSGYRTYDGTLFNFLHRQAFFWSSTQSTNNASLINIINNIDNVGSPAIDKRYGLSVRCLKN